ncbi:MAG TPA: sulfurtransferase [Verrucomicrobiales bacterium]|nr:sulfurtransferase [Verrucomicrobiales bacterium]
MSVTNIAAYKFVRLKDLKPLREELLALCKQQRLRGTILLSEEGVNLFVAGEGEGIETLLQRLRALPGMADFEVKTSLSESQPFRRMLVRIKKEIISFGVDGIDPATRTSPKLSPRELKRWLDEGRPVTLLDTRNDYEVKLGTFKDALPAGISHFRQFPDAVRRMPESMKEQPVVMFCTGGIRCEKAGPFMEREGFKTIFQLDGGILKYFEECGSAHYDGECFVFDQRVGLDPHLEESEATQCYACQSPLTAEEQASPRYVAGESCPYCFKEPAERQEFTRAAYESALRRAATPLPGSIPYDNYRPLRVPDFCDERTLIEFLTAILPHQPRELWESAAAAGHLLDNDRRPLTVESRVRSGQQILHLHPATLEPGVNADLRVLHVDEALIVLNKPAPLPFHPGGRFNRNTLQYLLSVAFHPQRPRPAHRIDANTTGVTVVCRTRHFAGLIQKQFMRDEVEKVYLARVQGHPPEDAFVCDAPISDEPGRLGARTTDSGTLPSRTVCRVLRRDADGTSLVEARPLTGRTNQIRIHLWDLGFPILGDPLYLPGRRMGQTQTLALTDPPLHLHAHRISFTHPVTGLRVTFEAPPPW